MSASTIDSSDLQGMYRCRCGNFRWENIPRDRNTVEVPACHGLMRFTWNFIDRGYVASVRVLIETGAGK